MHLDEALWRTQELDERLRHVLQGRPTSQTLRDRCAVGFATLSWEHNHAVRVAFAAGCFSSAIGLMRIQFEALVRAVWAQHLADDAELAVLSADLAADSDRMAAGLPTVGKMVAAIEQAGDRVPDAPKQLLAQFKITNLRSLNSYVHAGIHPYVRHVKGFPEPLVVQALRNSNGLGVVTAMLIGTLTGDASIVRRIWRCHFNYRDVLPTVLGPQEGGPRNFLHQDGVIAL